MSLATGRTSLIPSPGPSDPPPGALATTIANQIANLVARVEALEQGLAGHAHATPTPASEAAEEPAANEPSRSSMALKNGDIIASIGDLSASNVAKMTKTELVTVCDMFPELGVTVAADHSKKDLQTAVLAGIVS